MEIRERDVIDRVTAGEAVSFAHSRTKQAAIAGGGVVLVAASAWLTSFDDTLVRIVGWVGVVFFAVGVLAAVAAALRPRRDALTLTREELVAGQGRRYQRVAWSDVAGAYLATIPAAANTRVAAVELVPGATEQVTHPDGSPRRTGPDAAQAYRRPDGSEPAGRLVVLPRGISGLSPQQATAIIDDVAGTLRQRPDVQQ